MNDADLATEHTIDFTNTIPAHFISSGWNQPSKLGTATVGHHSSLDLGPIKPANYRLEIKLWRFFDGLTPFQELLVFANGQPIGATRTRGWEILGYEIPRSALEATARLRLDFIHPNAARPCDLIGDSHDTLLLSVSMTQLNLRPAPLHMPAPRPVDIIEPGEPLTAIFESLGDNCEFGFIQRHHGDERLGLLRFAGAPIWHVVRGMLNGFEGVDSIGPDNLHFEGTEPDRHYMVKGGPYAMAYHTGFREQDSATSTDSLLRKIRTKLLFERRKMLEDLQEARKIFVFRGERINSINQILPLFWAIQTHGPNKLLWVTLADQTHPAGTVEQICPGLLRGNLGFFPSAETGGQAAIDDWNRICSAVRKLTNATTAP